MEYCKKIYDPDLLRDILIDLRQSKKLIVFTNGCFDLLHAGHVRYLNDARSHGDFLVVGLNSYESVRSIKGERRPVIPQSQRAEVLAGLGCVDYVTIFHEPDPFKLIEKIQPDVLVKGADWTEDKIIGADIVKKRGGKVIRIRLTPEVSTSKIIRKILITCGNPKERLC